MLKLLLLQPSQISEIPRLEQRLGCMIFKRTFTEKVTELRPNLDAVTKASKALKSSKSFHKILEIILLLGNYMNGTGRSGGALGFKLAAINKLVDTKSANNKMTLLHFIADTVEAKFPEVIKFVEELVDVDAASKGAFYFFQISSFSFSFFFSLDLNILILLSSIPANNAVRAERSAPGS